MFGKILAIAGIIALLCIAYALGQLAIDLHHYVVQMDNGYTAPWMNVIVRGPVQ